MSATYVILLVLLAVASHSNCTMQQPDDQFCANVERVQRHCMKKPEIIISGCAFASRETAKVWYGNGGVFNMILEGYVFEAYCDTKTDGGEWLVIQRRKDGSRNFYRNWKHYVNGFGEISGEFWLGLETIYALTSSGHYELRIDMEDWDGSRRFAKYSTFLVGDRNSRYQLTVKGYSGDAGDSLSLQNGMKFSTFDKDFDTYEKNCAEIFRGGWWYAACHHSNLNGLYINGGNHSTFADGINWYSWRGYHHSLKFAEMKIRRH